MAAGLAVNRVCGCPRVCWSARTRGDAAAAIADHQIASNRLESNPTKSPKRKPFLSQLWYQRYPLIQSLDRQFHELLARIQCLHDSAADQCWEKIYCYGNIMAIQYIYCLIMVDFPNIFIYLLWAKGAPYIAIYCKALLHE